MEKRAALIQELDEARKKIQAELIGLDPQMPICPGWTIKHLLAHLIGWDKVATASLRAYSLGQEAATPARDMNGYNAQSVAACEKLGYDHIMKNCELARDQLKAAILAVPDEKVAEPLLFPWGPTGTIRELVAIYAEHELEHAQELRNLKAHYPRSAQAQ